MQLTYKWLVIVVTVVLASSEAGRIPKHWPLNQLSRFTRNASHEEPSIPGVCNSSICQQDATEILESLDKSVDPCDDFYMFACGGWIEKNPTTKVKPAVSHYSETPPNVKAEIKLTLQVPISEDDISPLKAAKKMFQVCMDTETIERTGIQPLVDISNEVGWPLAMKDWKEEDFSLETVLAECDRRLFRSPFFLITADTHTNIFRLYIHIQGPEIGLTRSELLDPWEKETREAYKQLIANVSLEILNASNVSIPAESVLQHATEIVEFMRQLQNISVDHTTDGEGMTLKDLQELTDSAHSANATGQFNWLSYLQKILSDSKIVLDDEEEVVVYDQTYLFQLFKLLDNTPRRVIANYLHWSIIDSLKDATTKRMQELTLYSINETRSTYCFKNIMERFNHVLNSRIVPNVFNKDLEDNFRSFVESIRSGIINHIENISWMDEEEREQLTDGLKALNAYIGYPKDIYNNASFIVELYKKVIVTDDHFKNMMIMTPKDDLVSLPRLRKQFNLNDEIWLKTRPEAPIAFYVYYESALFLTFGMLQHHFYDINRLKSLNYGRIGNTVGHEIMHSISFTFMEYNWSNVTSGKVGAQHQCFIDQYDKFHYPELEEVKGMNVMVNGTVTLSENMADATGVNAAYKAYQTEMKNLPLEPRLPGLEEYSPDQLFYIGYGTAECESQSRASLERHLKDSHAPMSARVTGTVSNIADFARAFNCPAGSNMNPVNKCSIW